MTTKILSEQQKQFLKNNRINDMILSVEDDLREKLQSSIDLLEKIKQSKTSTKKKYYQQKFNKIRKELLEAVAAFQYLEKIKEKNNETQSNTTNPEHQDNN